MPHLVLTRGLYERVVIRYKGAEIVVYVEQLMGCQVRLAFEAPEKVKINREELQAKIDAEMRKKRKHFPHNLAYLVQRAFKALCP